MGLKIVIENETEEEPGEEEVGTCASCGEDIDADDNFCAGCGKKLPKVTSTDTKARLAALSKAIIPAEED